MLLQACAGLQWDDSAPPRERAASDRTASSGGKSSQGNPPFYVVFGQRYYVMDSGHGYREKGVASWYGKKFHGKPTSSGEIYDMHKMTAAHKALPLPTTVRVTNLQNGRSVVVVVNDRGPFVDNRIIDLSHAAAKRLDIIGAGTALVEVEALGSGPNPEPAPIEVKDLGPDPKQAPVVATTTLAPDSAPRGRVIRLYLQVGAFSERLNAELLQQQLQSIGISNAFILHDRDSDPALYRVRLGPINRVDQYDALIEKVASIQIDDTHLVTVSSANVPESSGG